MCIGSLDVEALYPSLDINHCAKLCGDPIRESKMTVSSIDYQWAGLYAVLNCTQLEVNQDNNEALVLMRR